VVAGVGASMKSKRNMTTIYLVCFHSVKNDTLNGSARQYLVVEQAIRGGEWPYDNGDDPSFFVARKGVYSPGVSVGRTFATR
jgi:hypothetical protein